MALRQIDYVSKARGAMPASVALLARREAMERDALAPPPGVVIRREPAGPGRAEWVEPASECGAATVLFLHGSGYSKGSPATHRELVARIALAAQTHAFVPDYRLTPEHPFPAALLDALQAYRFVLERTAPNQLIVVGDSAGGGLALALLLAARDCDMPMPAGVVTLSAWTDLAVTGPSTRPGAVDDPIVTGDMLRDAADLYLGGADPRSPYASPLYGDLSKLPPLLMQVGGREVMIDDTHRLAESARAAGVDVTVDVYEAMSHVFQWRASTHPERDNAVARIAAFIKERTEAGSGSGRLRTSGQGTSGRT